MSGANVVYSNIIRINHFILSIFLALFFIYAGVKKFIPKPPYSQQVKNEEFVKAFEENKFESPTTFRMAVKALKASDFLLMVGFLQILAGVLMIVPPTRLIGLLVLLPLTVNIFCFHFFMDNRADENLETGFLLLLNLVLIFFYYKNISMLLIRNWTFKFTKTI